MESDLTTEEIANLFRAADEDGSGFLSPTEIASIMTQLNGGVTPSEQDVASCLNAMDSNNDGEISEEEFLNAMRTWLGMVKVPTASGKLKRQLDTESSPAFSRKKTLNDMANFFRQFSTVPNFHAEQNRILSSRRKEIDMTAIHREYAMPSPEEKAAAYESIKVILEQGKREIVRELHSLDWSVVLEGVGKVNALLSVVEMFQSEDERFEFASTIFPIFEGLTEDNDGNDGSIVHRLCNLLNPEVPIAIQPGVYTPCLSALRNYIIGPCIPSVVTLTEDNVWNPEFGFTKQVVEREQLPLRLVQILDRHAVVTPTNQELLTAAVKCVSAFSEDHLGCLEAMLNIGFREKVIRILQQDATGLDLCRSALGCLAVLCGYSHVFDTNAVQSIPAAVGINEQELFNILVVVKSGCQKVLDAGMLDEILVMNLALVARYLLPLCNPADPLYKSILGSIMRLLENSWASEGAGLFTSISLDYCVVELMSSSPEMCSHLWLSTSISDVMFHQIQSISAQSMADVSSEICVSCLAFYDLLLEFNLLEILSHQKNQGFIKQCVTLLTSAECGNHVMKFLAKCMEYPSLLPTLQACGVFDGFFNVFTKFKQNVNTLSEVLGSYVGPVYSITAVKSIATHLQKLLTSDIENNTKFFNADHIDIIDQVHGVVCEELKKGQLKFSQELIDMTDALLELLEAIGNAHTTTRSRLAGVMSHEVGQISTKWNKELNAAYTTGSFVANPDMEIEIEAADAPIPLYSNHVFQKTDIEIIGIPLWERRDTANHGNKVFEATVPRDITVTRIRNGFSNMCQRAISIHFENDRHQCVPLVSESDLHVLINRACSVRSLKRPAITIYLKADSSSSSSSFSSASSSAALKAIPMGGKRKEQVLADLKREGARIGKNVNSKLMSAFYDYFREQNVQEINQQQFVLALTSEKLGYEENFAVDIFNGFDDDGNGTLSLTEIAIGFAKLMNGSTDDKLLLMFQAYDTDRNNHLDVEELTNMIMVSSGMSYEESFKHAQAVGTSVDENGDGWVDFEEFKKAAYLGLIPLGISWTADNSTGSQSQRHQGYQKTYTRQPPPMQRAHSHDAYDHSDGARYGDEGPIYRSQTFDNSHSRGGSVPVPGLTRSGGEGGGTKREAVPALTRSVNSESGGADSLKAVRKSVTERKTNPFGNKKK